MPQSLGVLVSIYFKRVFLRYMYTCGQAQNIHKKGTGQKHQKQITNHVAPPRHHGTEAPVAAGLN